MLELLDVEENFRISRKFKNFQKMLELLEFQENARISRKC